MAGIYIHIPFCRKHCFYCDFHFKVDKSVDNEMIKAILLDIEHQKDFLETREIETVYFGGGTPSMLTEEQLEAIMGKLKECFTLKKGGEITFEANPEDVNDENLSIWRKAGINRLSIGIQSFYEEDLVWMNRNHTAQQGITAIQKAQAHGFDKITIDLIFGFPILTHEKWAYNVDTALQLNVNHISCYGLTVEKNTPLHLLIKTKRVAEPDDALAVEQFDYLMNRLRKEGWEHYEISNFAKGAAYGVHNHNYWKMEAYIGIGPSAHGFNGKVRRANNAHNKRYIKILKLGRRYYNDEVLSYADLYNDYLLVSIRTSDGICKNNLPEGTEEFWEQSIKNIQQFIDKGWVKLLLSGNNNQFVLTQKGKHFADAITRELLV